MKWLFLILILIFAGWKMAGYLMNNGQGGTITITDSLQAKGPLADSTLKDSVGKALAGRDTIAKPSLPDNANHINDGKVSPQVVVAFAKTLIGTPYLYGSVDPAKGFDCSGFITYVFTHFDITVPRSSIDFTNRGKEVSTTAAKEGDLILFTGTDSAERVVGHMGIVVSNTDTLRFIHATSGKQYGVTITALTPYYKGRYVKTIRVFPD